MAGDVGMDPGQRGAALPRATLVRIAWPLLSLGALVLLWEVAALLAAYSGKARTLVTIAACLEDS